LLRAVTATRETCARWSLAYASRRPAVQAKAPAGGAGSVDRTVRYSRLPCS
jgi:hypothetical protein